MTKHFSFDELTFSEIAERRGIVNKPGSIDIENNIYRLMDTLEVIRELLGNKPIIVTSGYRSSIINSIVSGSKTSSHMRGLAADIKVIGLTPKEVATTLAKNISTLGLDQIIYEGSWVHVSIPEIGRPARLNVLTAVFHDSGTVYVGGIK